IDTITGNKVLKLRKFELDADDWKIVEDLVHILVVSSLLHTLPTLFYSQDTVCTIANVIPSMDKIDEVLHPQSISQQYYPAIQAVMRLGKATMNRYYSKTDSSNVYRIAMVLHPGLKLEYFQQNDWEDEWVEDAEHLTWDEYKAQYKDHTDETVDGDGPDSRMEVCYDVIHLFLPLLIDTRFLMMNMGALQMSLWLGKSHPVIS
ncbi:hypothetical protein JAAARDRAFT_143779, partial [Jaapia argillacea MUCL 33604]